MSDRNFKILQEQVYLPTTHLINWTVILLIVLNLLISLSNRLPEAYHRTGGMGFFLLGIVIVGAILRELASYYQYVVTEESFQIEKRWGKRKKRLVLQIKFENIVYYGPIQDAGDSPSRHPRRFLRTWKKGDRYALDYRVGEEDRRIILQNTPRIERVMTRMLRGATRR